jgi:Ca-activated chloride channel family protein
MYFEFPDALLLVSVLPFLYWVLKRGEARTTQTAGIYKGVPPQKWFYNVRFLLICLFTGSITLVAARPYIESGKTGDLVFLVDVSRSMDARHSCGDLTFLNRSKNIMKNVIAGLPEARFGIIAFDRFAFPVTHMTRDQDYLREVIDQAVHIGLTFEATRTELANALNVTAEKKIRLPQIYGNVKHVILLSDGHISGDYVRNLSQPLKQLRDAGISILAVGVGNPGETPIMNTDRDQCTNEFIETDGKVVFIPLRDDILKYIATESKGLYFAEGDGAGLLRYLKAGLTQVETADATAGGRYRRDVSLMFLLTGTIAMFGLLVLTPSTRDTG